MTLLLLCAGGNAMANVVSETHEAGESDDMFLDATRWKQNYILIPNYFWLSLKNISCVYLIIKVSWI